MATKVYWHFLAAWILASMVGSSAHAVLQPLAYYRLGESDAGATAGASVTTSVESLGLTENRDFLVVGDPAGVKYSSDVIGYTTSDLSIQFDNSDPYLSTEATPWYSGTGGFRWGMELFIKPDAALQGLQSVFFGNGSQFSMGMSDDGFFYVNQTINQAPRGITPVKYGQWQHIAFITTGSVWQIYVDGVAQFATLPNFSYGAPSGTASLGSDANGVETFTGYLDEHRVFTWSGAFNPNDLFWFQLRPPGDVNDDGMVNSGDYDIWRANVGADLTGTTALEGRALGDLNGDRQINLADFGIIKTNKTPGATLIPEPGAAALLLMGVAALGLRRTRAARRPRIALVAGIALSAALLQAGDASAQATATWNGGSGNWTDANWTGGSGAGGRPGVGDAIVLPASTGTLTVSSNFADAFDTMNQQGGLLDITPAGVLNFTGLFENGKGAATGGETRIAGQLIIGNGFNVGFDTAATVSVLGSGVLNVATAPMDTWWADGSVFNITGGGSDITVADIFYYGPAATLNANISSASFSTVKVQNALSIQGGTLNANFVSGFVPTVGSSWTIFDAANRAGEIINVNGSINGGSLPPGMRLVVDYEAGGTLGQVVSLNVVSTLNLKIDAGTGAMTIQNPVTGATPMAIDGYIIRSASSSLDPTAFTGVGAAGWLPGLPPSQSAGLISETNFSGSLSVAQGASYPIGGAFDGTSIEDQDLTFEFRLTSGETLPGTIEYVGAPGFPADFNNNGQVDAPDLGVWQGAYGSGGGADADGDGDSDGADFLTWQRTLGAGAPAATAAVPEPSSVLALLSGVVALLAARRRGC